MVNANYTVVTSDGSNKICCCSVVVFIDMFFFACQSIVVVINRRSHYVETKCISHYICDHTLFDYKFYFFVIYITYGKNIS